MTFEFDAEKYKAASAHQKEWGKKMVSELNFTGNERILDLGSGDGGITAQLAKLVPNGQAIGIDASQSMIDLAQKTHKAKNLKFELMNINTIGFDSEFDIVFSNAALHWVKDHPLLLANVYKGLKADGVLRFNFAADGNCSNLYKVLKKVIAGKKYAEYFSDYVWPWYMPPVDEYEKIVTQSGFTEVKVWGENADRYFVDAETMTGWIDQPSLVPFLKCVGQKDKQCFRDTVVERMIEQTIQDDGRCFEIFRRINVFAKK